MLKTNTTHTTEDGGLERSPGGLRCRAVAVPRGKRDTALCARRWPSVCSATCLTLGVGCADGRPGLGGGVLYCLAIDLFLFGDHEVLHSIPAVARRPTSQRFSGGPYNPRRRNWKYSRS